MMFEILTHTPKWVFGLLLFLIILGFQQSKDRNVKQYLIFPLPVGMAFLSYFGLLSSFGLSAIPMGLWIAGLVGMAFLVAKLFPVKAIKFNSEEQCFCIPGSWIPLVLMLAIFFTKYLVGVLNALNPAMVSEPIFIVTCSLIYGSFSGIFSARAYSIWHTKGVQSAGNNA